MSPQRLCLLSESLQSPRELQDPTQNSPHPWLDSHIPAMARIPDSSQPAPAALTWPRAAGQAGNSCTAAVPSLLLPPLSLGTPCTAQGSHTQLPWEGSSGIHPGAAVLQVQGWERHSLPSRVKRHLWFALLQNNAQASPPLSRPE